VLRDKQFPGFSRITVP